MSNTVKILKLCDHIVACADLWEKSGVSRVRTITRTAQEIATLVNEEKKVSDVNPAG